MDLPYSENVCPSEKKVCVPPKHESSLSAVNTAGKEVVVVTLKSWDVLDVARLM